MKRVLKFGLRLGLVGGAVGGVLYAKRLRENAAVSGKDVLKENQARLDALATLAGAEIQLFGYQTCPFTGTVRAALDFSGLNYVYNEVEPIFKSELKQDPSCSYTKVPVVRIMPADDDPTPIWLADSTLITDSLANKLAEQQSHQRVGGSSSWFSSGAASADDDAPVVLPSGLLVRTSDPAVDQWRTWSRGIFARLIVVNINRSVKDAYNNYNYIDQYEHIPAMNRLFLKVIGGPVMFMVARFVTPGRLRKLGVEVKGADVAQVLADQVEGMTRDGLAEGRKAFLGGDHVSLADTDVFGIVRSLNGHQLQSELLGRNRVFAEWFDRMQSAAAEK